MTESKRDYAAESLKMHYEKRGKIAVVSTVPVRTREDLSLAYTPGVAQPCLEIQKDVEKSFDLTRRWNMCLVVTDGTAVLGLGDIGPEAGMPVMEGKCVLFKTFGDVDAFPLCIKSKDVDEIVKTIHLISGSFGGVNLEDISAPRCFEIERRLKEICDIPIFHDDQHGTAVVTLAGLANALRLVGKRPDQGRGGLNSHIHHKASAYIWNKGRDIMRPHRSCVQGTGTGHECRQGGDSRNHQPGMPQRHFKRSNRRSRCVYWCQRPRYPDRGDGGLHGGGCDYICLRQSYAGDLSGAGKSSRGKGCGNRPQ